MRLAGFILNEDLAAILNGVPGDLGKAKVQICAASRAFKGRRVGRKGFLVSALAGPTVLFSASRMRPGPWLH